MNKFINKNWLLILGFVLVFTYSFNPTISILASCIFFQIVCTQGIIKQMNLYKNIQKNNNKYVNGYLTEVRKISRHEDEVHNYEGIIEFYFPNIESKHKIKHKFSSFSKPDIPKEYKICINEKNPSTSIVLDYFSHYWKFSVFALSCTIVGLLVVNFFLIKKLL
jgi:hypothetical protein